MQPNEEITQAIALHPSDDLAVISRDLTQRFGQTVPVHLVMRVRGSMARNANVSRAKEVASNTLDTKVDRIERASDVLEVLFHDDSLPLKDRIEASKELRQWTKLGMDIAGIADPESEALFVVSGEWVPGGQKK